MGMRIVFIGCVEFSARALDVLLKHTDAEIVGVVTREASAFNSDFRSLQPTAERHGIPCFLSRGNDQQAMACWIEAQAPDVVYCFGWSYLLRQEILSLAPLGVVGYHPAALPRNRGRHPIIWALALGLRSTASTFFFMDEGADSGDLLSQVPVAINASDDARSLYDRLISVASEQIRLFTTTLANGTYERTPQDDTDVNYWRKRSKADGRIDWRMSSHRIDCLVRALVAPYPGAHFDLGDREVVVWNAERADDEFADTDHFEPGRVLAIEKAAFVVKCGSGALRVLVCDPPLSDLLLESYVI
jgi:methionyl-tRNA formyltransferase